ncbi:hypothetical protein Syun_025884 [Stephania yunnanensis]|uniref:Uncharacterized protein n=1 Tax=Stephania yunnanensis TaxID=152371 RepID=A0AAP0ESY8_9MAGN
MDCPVIAGDERIAADGVEHAVSWMRILARMSVSTLWSCYWNSCCRRRITSIWSCMEVTTVITSSRATGPEVPDVGLGPMILGVNAQVDKAQTLSRDREREREREVLTLLFILF